jgi:hypothetical protein
MMGKSFLHPFEGLVSIDCGIAIAISKELKHVTHLRIFSADNRNGIVAETTSVARYCPSLNQFEVVDFYSAMRKHSRMASSSLETAQRIRQWYLEGRRKPPTYIIVTVPELKKLDAYPSPIEISFGTPTIVSSSDAKQPPSYTAGFRQLPASSVELESDNLLSVSQFHGTGGRVHGKRLASPPWQDDPYRGRMIATAERARGESFCTAFIRILSFSLCGRDDGLPQCSCGCLDW